MSKVKEQQQKQLSDAEAETLNSDEEGGFLNLFEMIRFVKWNQVKNFDAIEKRFKLKEEDSQFVMDYLRNITIDFLYGGLFITDKNQNLLFKAKDTYIINMQNVPILEGGTQNAPLTYALKKKDNKDEVALVGSKLLNSMNSGSKDIANVR